MRNRLFLTCFLIVSTKAFASEVQSQTTLGTGSLTEELSYFGSSHEESEGPDKVGNWDWSLSYTYSKINLGASVNATQGASKASESDHTSTFSGGFGYSKRWSAGFDLNYSKTKEEYLSSIGPSLHAGYTFDLGNQKKDDDSDEYFIPTLNLSLTGAATQYTQNFTAAVRSGSRRLNPRAGSQGISQREAELKLAVAAVNWVDFSLAFKAYSYDKNVANFISNLDDPRAAESGAANFGSTLTGFSSKEISVDLTFHLPLDLDLETDYSQSTSAADSTKTNTLRADLSHTWIDRWKTGMGYEQNKSATDTQGQIVVSLAYEF